MPAAGNGDQLIGHTGFAQSFVKSDAVLIRHGRVGVAVNGENRRQPGSDVCQRRNPARYIFTIRHRPEPLHRRIGAVRPFDDIVNIRDTEPIDNRSDLG